MTSVQKAVHNQKGKRNTEHIISITVLQNIQQQTAMSTCIKEEITRKQQNKNTQSPIMVTNYPSSMSNVIWHQWC